MPAIVPTGVFWVDEEDALDDPGARLAMARQYLPLPAAFREAVEALRDLIRAHSGRSADHSDLLSQLYLTAAQQDFLLATPDVPGVGPCYSVIMTIPKRAWLELPMPYAIIGYRHLPLLTRADHRRLVAEWGEPDSHCSARDHHRAVWDEYVAAYRGTF
jgi:hypothetical protein